MSVKRFRIALSFAGEKRDFVKQIADILAKQFGEEKILYDKFHEAEFAQANLAFDLPNLYKLDSDLVVSVFCPDYEQKEWCGLEWRAIFSIIKEGGAKQILLTRFEHVDGKGLYGLSGFIELDRKTPEQAATLILERLALNEDRPKEYYTQNPSDTKVKSRANIPNNLPRLLPFFGRVDELKTIADALAPEARGWGVLIDGPGGIGKTALAIHAAELVPAERFKRIIFLSAKERELSADGQRAIGYFVLPSYLEMLNAIAREIEQPELTKSLETERSETILRALRDKDVLLLLDNLETLPEIDRNHLFAFLNRLPRGCSAIVTSRRRADASAVTVRLDKLDWPAAKELLAELSQHNNRLQQAGETAWKALYEETGGNPLLMRWVVGQLGLGRCKTIANALDFLRSAPVGNNPLEFIFGDLLDTFTDNETKVLAALTHFTTPMAIKFIAELASLNESAAEGALSDLSSRALVLPDLEERHFALVPMVADFLRQERPEVVKETGDRLEEYAYALIVENGYAKHDRFPVLDDAWPTLAPALQLFLAGPNPRLQTVCDALVAFFNFTGRRDEWLSLEQQAATRAISAEDFYSAGWRVYGVGFIHFLSQNSDLVLDCADRAAAYWKAAKAGVMERATAINLRGLGQRLKKDYPAAITAHREAIELCRSLSAESVDVAICLNNLASTERDAQDFTAAEQDYCEALRIAQLIGYAEGVATYTGNLAELANDLKDWPNAERLACKALALSEQVGRQELIGSDCCHLAKALVSQGQADEALPYARRAVEIYTKLGLPALAEAQKTLRACEGL
jgi:tetratricopeptide (TPR) repeat protein